jgi:hypothetical protein
MTRRVITLVVVLLTLSAGVAYAAAQMTTTDGTQVCVNKTNGTMRVDSICRETEYQLTIGGGGSDVRVTQNGTFTVPAGQMVGKTLPLTGITVSGDCSEPVTGVLLARPLLDAASGHTMDVFASVMGSGRGTVGATSLLLPPVASGGPATPPPGTSPGAGTVVATSNNATATVTVGGTVTYTDTIKNCTFLWQAVEAPN